MAEPFITLGYDCSQGSDDPAWRKRRDGWEWMPVGEADPAFPAPGMLRVPEMSAAEFHRRYVVNREGIVGRDADLPAVGSFHA